MQEDIAKIIYEAMTWAAKEGLPPSGKVPAWVQGGNSDAQERARTATYKISEMYADLIRGDSTSGEPD